MVAIIYFYKHTSVKNRNENWLSCTCVSEIVVSFKMFLFYVIFAENHMYRVNCRPEAVYFKKVLNLFSRCNFCLKVDHNRTQTVGGEVRLGR